MAFSKKPFSLSTISRVAILLNFFIVFQSSTAQQVVVKGGKFATYNTPITITINQPADKNHYGLYNPASKKTYALQWFTKDQAIFMLTDSIDAGKEIKLSLKKISAPTSPFDIHESSAGLEIRLKEKPVFFYHTAMSEPPPDSPSYYRRSGFIHPLYSPEGTVMTDDFPSSHAHQHGVFHAWTNNTYKKKHVDFWNQHQNTGTIQFKELVSKTTGPVFAELKTKQQYVSLEFGVVLEEEWTIRVYPLMDQFLFELSLEQTNITSDTLFLNKYIYGGMAFRGTREWDPFNKKYFKNNWNVLTSEGVKDSLANNTAVRWATAYGNIDGVMSSATVFNHPTNVRYPQKIRVHPNMPYWVYAPVIDGELSIAPAEKYKASYLYYISNTKPDNSSLERIDENWIHPPSVKVIAGK